MTDFQKIKSREIVGMQRELGRVIYSHDCLTQLDSLMSEIAKSGVRDSQDSAANAEIDRTLRFFKTGLIKDDEDLSASLVEIAGCLISFVGNLNEYKNLHRVSTDTVASLFINHFKAVNEELEKISLDDPAQLNSNLGNIVFLLANTKQSNFLLTTLNPEQYENGEEAPLPPIMRDYIRIKQRLFDEGVIKKNHDVEEELVGMSIKFLFERVKRLDYLDISTYHDNWRDLPRQQQLELNLRTYDILLEKFNCDQFIFIQAISASSEKGAPLDNALTAFRDLLGVFFNPEKQ